MLFSQVFAALAPQAAAEAALLISQRRGGAFGEVQAFVSQYFWAIVVVGVVLVLILMVFGPKTRV